MGERRAESFGWPPVTGRSNRRLDFKAALFARGLADPPNEAPTAGGCSKTRGASAFPERGPERGDCAPFGA